MDETRPCYLEYSWILVYVHNMFKVNRIYAFDLCQKTQNWPSLSMQNKRLDSELPIITSALDPFLPSLPSTTTPETTILPDSLYPKIDDLNCPTIDDLNCPTLPVSDEISVCFDLDNRSPPPLSQYCPKIPEISPFPSCIAPSPFKKR